MKTRFLCILYLAIQFSSFARIEPIPLTSDEQWVDIGNRMEFLIDKTGKWSIDEIAQAEFDKHFFTPTSKGGYLYPEDMDAVYWARFRVKNMSEAKQNWLVEILNFGTRDLSFYHSKPGGGFEEVARTGADREFSDRVFDHKNFEFDLGVTSGTEEVFYMRFKAAGPSKMAIVIKSYERFISYSLGEYYMLGLFYGIILVMVVYNLILFFTMRIKTYLYYVIYVASIGLASIAQDGTGFQFLWPSHPGWTNHLSEIALFAIIVATIQYSRNFLDMKKESPRLDGLLQKMIWGVLGIFVIVEIVGVRNLFFLVPVSAIPFSLILITSFHIYKSGARSARFFIIGFSFFFIGFAIKILGYFGLIVNNPVTYYAHNLGTLVEMVFFSAAIADRFRTLRQEKENALKEKNEQLERNEKLKDKVNRELEEKVKERTLEVEAKNEELGEANVKLQQLTDEVNQMNLRLDLDNRKLQKDIKEVSRSRVMLTDVSFSEFSEVYPQERDCLIFLADLKWNAGYKCRKCGNEKFSQGKNKFSRRCTTCNYDESATANTLFHRLKFPIQKAFYMVYLVNSREGKVTSDELSDRLDLRRETCWSFKKKIGSAMDKSSKSKRGSKEIDGWGELALV